MSHLARTKCNERLYQGPQPEWFERARATVFSKLVKIEWSDLLFECFFPVILSFHLSEMQIDPQIGLANPDA